LVPVIAINLATGETRGITSYSTTHILFCHTNVQEEEVPENIETI